MTETICPFCGKPIIDGEPRVSWFNGRRGTGLSGWFTTQRGAVHLSCLAVRPS